MKQAIGGVVRVAAAVPRLRVGDVSYNVAASIASAQAAAAEQAAVVVLPELGLTGYTLGDLVQQPQLLEAAQAGLLELASATAKLPLTLVVGLPLAINGQLYNLAAVVSQGRVAGLVPKSYLPNYQEFYEARWYTSGQALRATEVVLTGGVSVPVGTDLLFHYPQIPGLVLGIEICEDLWAPLPPSSLAAPAGATVMANLSASNELADKARYRRALVEQQSARTHTAYIYTSCGVDESTTDVVFSGHTLIAENGQLVAEGERFARRASLVTADIDLEHLALERLRGGTFHLPPGLAEAPWRTIAIDQAPVSLGESRRSVDPTPFIPSAGPERDARMAEIFALQRGALATRLEQSGLEQIVLGLSGGLDSTLALLVAVGALNDLKLPLTNLHSLTLPGLATSDRTKSNAHLLAKALNLPLEEIPIGTGSRQQLADLGHDATTQDITYENAQARYRTLLLLGRANQIKGLMLGTGDLSEIALGWATFNGDHISHYHVNAGVPKTLVRHLVAWAAAQPEFTDARTVLTDILATPISPELTAAKAGEIDQSTEDVIGPYELVDFYLYHFIRWGSESTKLLALAHAAFGAKYTEEELRHWLVSFLTRFFGAQWKRSVMPDGPKVGSVSLSPRGDWRMPSVMSAKLWLDTLQ